MQAKIMEECALNACTEKVESSIVPALKLRVNAHVDALVLPGLQARVDTYVNTHIDKRILPNLDECIQRHVDERVDELFKSTLLSQDHSYHDVFFALLLP